MVVNLLRLYAYIVARVVNCYNLHILKSNQISEKTLLIFREREKGDETISYHNKLLND